MQEKTQYVQINQYTRPGKKNQDVKGIVWHYTASPAASAQNIRDYFNVTCIRDKRYASAHDVIDTKHIIHMIPHDEVAYHAHDKNRCLVKQLDTNANYTAIGVEICVDKDMQLEDATYDNAVFYGVELAKKYNLDPKKDFFRHYDVTRKNCPAFWVEDQAGFDEFKQDVYDKLHPVKVVKHETKVEAESIHKNLQKGDNGSEVTQLQEKLLRVGEKLPRYGADGDFGTETEYAVKAFQARAHIVVDGIVGPLTIAALDKALAYPGHIIKKGDKGELVERIQTMLGITVDGIFGPMTERAVKEFQKDHGLKEDGIVGPNTWTKLF